MNISSLDITLGRIRQIESRLSLIDKKINQLDGNSAITSKSFDNVLNEKIKDVRTEDVKTNKTTSLPESFDRKDITQLIEKYARKNGLDENLVNAVIQTESGFNNEAVSSAGAQGLMQLMPFTSEKLGVSDPFNPEQNIAGGTKYLKNLIDRYDSVKLGLAAYNAGPGSVNKYGGVPPYDETQNYVRKILDLQKKL